MDNYNDIEMEEETFNYSDIEEEGEEEEDNMTNEESEESSVLMGLVEASDWAGCLTRINTHPEECHEVEGYGRTPLHVACDNDAPAVVVQAMLQAYPEASVRTGRYSELARVFLVLLTLARFGEGKTCRAKLPKG